MKLIAELKRPSLIKKHNVDGWIVNVKGLSCYYDITYTCDELKEIITEIHDNNQKVYVNVRKIIHEQDINHIIEILKKLESLNVDYYFYGDVTFYEIAEKLNIKHKIIYQVNTYMTNALDIEIMLLENHSVVVSTEISFEEINCIVKNIQKPLYLHAFGYYPIFHSRRELITNYQKYRGLNPNITNEYDVVEELRDSHYPIEQNENGMVVYIDGAYYLSHEIKQLNDYNREIIYILTSKFIDLEVYEEVLDLYISIEKGNEEHQIFEKLKLILTKGLLYETSKLLKKEGSGEVE